MRSNLPVLVAALAASAVAAAGSAQAPTIDPDEPRALSEIPIRVSSHGRNGFTHVQFPVPCAKCFPSEPLKPSAGLEDGLLEFDVRITRHLGLDGEAGAQVNGYTVNDADFPILATEDSERGNIVSAIRLFAPPQHDAAGQAIPGPHTVALWGNISFETLVYNGTHDVRGVVYNITHVDDAAGSVPAVPAGFRASYSRRPDNSILRIEQGALGEGEAYPFADKEAWIAPGEARHFAWKPQGLDWINPAHDRYAGWDPYFVTCMTVACRVNKMHTSVTETYDGCVERVERPESFDADDRALPPQCYAYLLPYWAKNNMMWVGAAFAGILSTVLRMSMEAKKERAVKAKKQEVLDEQLLERMEDDAVSYLMEVEGVAATSADKAEEVKEEKLIERKGYEKEDDE